MGSFVRSALKKKMEMKRFRDGKSADEVAKSKKTKYSEIERYDDNIMNFNVLKKNYLFVLKKHLDFWNVLLDEVLVFYRLDVSNCPTVSMSVKINRNLQVQIYSPSDELLEYFDANNLPRVTRWSQLQNILGNLESISEKEFSQNIEYCLAQALKHLNNSLQMSSQNGNNSSSLGKKIDFWINQILLIKCKKFSEETLNFACTIYLKSSTCYKELRNLGYITLPSEKHLWQHITSQELSNNSLD